MTPETNQYVKVVLKNSMVIGGVVISWEENQACIQSLETNDVIIINNLKENVVLIKICYEENNNYIENQKRLEQKERAKSNIPRDIARAETERQMNEEKTLLEEELKNLPSFTPQKNQTLAKLRLSIKEIDEKIVKSKLSSHIPTEIKNHYAYPNFFTNRSSK